jgi:predicted O-methyltransferase YrrM
MPGTIRQRITRAGRRTLNAVVARSLTRSSPLRGAAKYAAERAVRELTAQSDEDLFLRNASAGRYDRKVRSDILRRFRRIDREVSIKSTPSDGLFLAEALLSLVCHGAVVECGCFSGGSTAKLSIVAKATQRRLVVFDSFEGLPASGDDDAADVHVRRPIKRPWRPGEYAVPLDAVKETVREYGELDVCTFVKGWFQDTLRSGLPDRVAFAFTDVDLSSSARECLIHVWPRLAEGGVYFSHDVAFVKVLLALNDEQLWRDILREHPPVFFGAGFGMSDSSPHLGFAVKGRPSAQYIKGLTYRK